jgi:vacuolar-type H+-ATPase subunit E/Vma4
MSGDLHDSGSLELEKGIAVDADAQVRALLDQAQAVVSAENGKTSEEANALRAAILAKAREKADRLIARERALATAEAQRIELSAREAAVLKGFERIRAELSAMHANRETYRQSLQVLAAEAIRGIAEPEVRLRFSAIDEALADAVFLEALRADVKACSGHNCTVHASFDLADAGGGCSAEATSGRYILNNTYTRRLELARRSLRTAIMREAAKRHE